jgi:hypothetical protein
MIRRNSLAISLIIVLAGLSFYALVWHGHLRREASDIRSESNLAHALPSVSLGTNFSRQLLGREWNDRDKKVWLKELIAEEHEDVFIRLWDNLRTQSNSFSVLEQFAFRELLVGTLSEKVMMDHQIAVTHFGPPLQHLDKGQWRQLLQDLKQQGYRLEQSEWRHPQFVFDTNGSSRSIIAMSLHVLDPAHEERFILRGNLRVAWRKETEPNAEPFPEMIDATDLKLLSRRGETPFHHVTAADITPENKNAKSLEPNLQLYDLDGDGLSEIILARRNRVFWNRGQGVFGTEPLFQYPLDDLQTGLFGDFDGDGLVDFLGVDSQGLALFKGERDGHFPNPAKRIRFTEQELANPFVMTAGDIDRDGDLDVWLAQYKVPYQGGQMPTPYYDANDGHPSFLLLNDGKGNFQDCTESAGLKSKRFRRTYSASFVDLDGDGDLDLLVVSDFAGADIYANDGRGHFTDVTSEWLDESHAFGMAHTFGDYDLDGQLDFLVIGMNSFTAQRLDGLNIGPPQFEEYNRMRPKMGFGNRMYLRRNSHFQETALSKEVSRTGWSWGATTGDFDNDGDPDIYVANGHISGQSAKDYENQFWTHDIYAGSSKENPAREARFRLIGSKHSAAGHSYGGFEKNRFFLNRAGISFLEVGYLMGVALEEDCRNVVADDLDGDGKLDLLVTTFTGWPSIRQELHLFPNFMTDVGNWIGVRLREAGSGFSPTGAKIILSTSAGKQIRHLVTGDSYRSQHATTAHFGLGKEWEVKRLEVVWLNGVRKTILNPEINRYHLVTPEK